MQFRPLEVGTVCVKFWQAARGSAVRVCSEGLKSQRGPHTERRKRRAMSLANTCEKLLSGFRVLSLACGMPVDMRTLQHVKCPKPWQPAKLNLVPYTWRGAFLIFEAVNSEP